MTDIGESKLIRLLDHKFLFRLGKNYHNLNVAELLVTRATISNYVGQLANHYRSQLQSMLIETSSKWMFMFMS